jgi:hypothetical protein
MTTEKKIAANRANAKLSTGPRTKSSKARTSRNALRHGLAVSLASDPALSAAAERLGRVIMGDDTDQLSSARIAAHASTELLRVRSARTQLLKEAGDFKDPEAISKALQGLIKTDRYERRALSLLKKAFREPTTKSWRSSGQLDGAGTR